ncbi:MAG TPA: TetR family transcriptional regulator [Jatrophihabitans sp.]|uniref:TetR/AcrR family transcriptional regulator n=1 Tax=Jatrophihabitans sp. TaxID=1932789 RepID=UPI002DFBBCC0|nr:TetR family transcriptional regulator [Jatrophihabitans sp.]
MTSTRAYRGVSADERRELRRATLLDTALDCLHDDGLSGVSVRSICARARLTPRYFYESFADLDALLVAAVDAVVDEVAAAALAGVASAGDDTAAQVRAAVDAGYGVVVTDARKANAFLVAAAGHGPLRERRHRVVTDFADLMMDNLSALSAQDPGQRREARATALFLMGGAAEVIEATLAGRLRMSRAALVDHLTRLWLGALGEGLGRTG